jgi:DNA-binding SARP family transcriptional activator
MLKLLGTSPGWHDGARLQPLPDTVPGWTIAYLAVAADWVPRERLCALLWPQAAAAEAQHSLRMNLHRMRGVLSAWGQPDALEADRRRVRLQLPTDTDAFRRDADIG